MKCIARVAEHILIGDDEDDVDYSVQESVRW